MSDRRSYRHFVSGDHLAESQFVDQAALAVLPGVIASASASSAESIASRAYAIGLAMLNERRRLMKGAE